MKIVAENLYTGNRFITVEFSWDDLREMGFPTYGDGSKKSKLLLTRIKELIDSNQAAREICIRDHAAIGILKKLRDAIDKTEGLRKEFLQCDGIFKEATT